MRAPSIGRREREGEDWHRGSHRLHLRGTTRSVRGALAFGDAAQAASVKLPRTRVGRVDAVKLSIVPASSISDRIKDSRSVSDGLTVTPLSASTCGRHRNAIEAAMAW